MGMGCAGVASQEMQVIGVTCKEWGETGGANGRGKDLSLCHISARLTSFWVIVATDNQLLLLHVEKHPVGHTVLERGIQTKPGVCSPRTVLPNQGCVSESARSFRTCTFMFLPPENLPLAK